MVPVSEIKLLCDEIVEKFHPEKVILFGSYANGTPTEESDVDLFVLMKHDGREIDQLTSIYTAVRRSFPIEIVVRSPEILKQRLEWNDCSLREIVGKGKVLYESRH